MCLTIVIPTLNRLAELQNVLEKTMLWKSSPEIIVIDQTRQYFNNEPNPNFSSPDGRLKHIYVNFVGVCRARNYGASLASHEILLFFDDDVDPDTNDDLAEYACHHFERFPNSVLTGGVRGSEFVAKESKRFDIISQFTGDVPVFYKDNYRFALPVAGGIMAVPRTVFLYLNGFDEAFDPAGLEDRDFGLKCYFHGVPVCRNRKFEVIHVGATTGGRRDNSRDWRNRHFLWMKYLSEDNYYLQSFVYWITQPGIKKRWLRELLLWLVKTFIRPPVYPRSVSERSVDESKQIKNL